MRKIISIFLLLLILLTNVYGFTPYQKPHPGLQINWANPSSKGLVAFWLFNEDSGNIVFDLSGGNTGTFGAGAASPSWTAGKFGSCLSLDGGDSLIITENINLDGFAQMSLFIWCQAASGAQVDDWAILFHKAAISYYIAQNGSINQLTYYIKTGGVADSIAGATPFWDGNWHLVGSTDDGTWFRAYEDGIEVASLEKSGPVLDSAFNPYVGSQGGSENFFDGKLDLPMIFNRALSASEIAELYREPFGMFVKDDIAILATAAVPPPPPTGQVITIIITVAPFLIIPAYIFTKKRKAA